MIIGVPKEIKNNENRVALTPAGTQELVKRGHTVYIERNAGAGSGFGDEDYKKAGAQILNQASEVFEKAEMIIKVKEPVEQEYKLIRRDQLIFTYRIENNNWTDGEGKDQYGYNFIVDGFEFGAPGQAKRDEMNAASQPAPAPAKSKAAGRK